MILTAKDKWALEVTRKCIRNCAAYHTTPAPYFPLLLRMFKELEDAGMIQWEEGVKEDG